MKAVKLHHRLADIQITPLAVVRVSALKEFILHALDNYVETEAVSLSKIRARTKMRHGDAYETPGYYLRIYRTRADITQAELAMKINIRQHHISEMENNKRMIGKELAKKLATALNCDYRKFL
jgi:DNA-binding XRE family transcriptional regulator